MKDDSTVFSSCPPIKLGANTNSLGWGEGGGVSHYIKKLITTILSQKTALKTSTRMKFSILQENPSLSETNWVKHQTANFISVQFMITLSFRVNWGYMYDDMYM